MKRVVVAVIAVWGGLLLLGALCSGVGVWQLRSAAEAIRKDNLNTDNVKQLADGIRWSNIFLNGARLNPSVQSLRVVPGVSWVPKFITSGSQVVSEVNDLLDIGAKDILNIGLSGDLTSQPGTIAMDSALVLAQRAEQLEGNLEGLRSAIAGLGGLRIPGFSPSRIDEATKQALDLLDVAESAVEAMKFLPQLIGQDAPTRYFVGITNQAELRGVQGIIGEYAIVKVESGKISVERSGSNTDLVNPDVLPDELIGEYSNIYGLTNTEWQNMNLSPFLDPAAKQITAAWKMQTGQHLDGVVLLDTVALAKWAIQTVGVVESAQGRELQTWEALADYLSNGIYFEFPADQFARKEFQSEIARNLISAITNSKIVLPQLVKSLAEPMVDGRIVVWLNGEYGATFNTTLLSRSTAWSQDSVVIGFNNLTGNKMDFYLGAVATWESCGLLVLDVSSSAKPLLEYPDYLTRRLDSDVEDLAGIGSYLDVGIALPVGLDVLSVSDESGEVAFDLYPIDGNRTIVRNTVEVLASESAKLRYRFSQHNVCGGWPIRVAPMRQHIVVR